MVLLSLVAGLLLLVVGAEALVRGASKLAAALGVSHLVIGLTVVAYGTSTPEMVVGVMSSLAGQPGIALGNVVGSNIFNVLFILGLSALIVPLIVSEQLVRLDVPVMVGVSVLMLVMSADGKVDRLDGLILFAAGVSYTAFLIYKSRKDRMDSQSEAAVTAVKGSTEPTSMRWWAANTALIAGGLGLLVLGARWLVESAVSIAQQLGVSELVIGLTIVAAGTSLPEVATSIIASVRGERDIAVGNVVGSNIFNILAVLGLSAVVAPGGVPVPTAAMGFDIPIMIAAAVACLPIFFTGNLIARWEGALFLGYYTAYTLYLVLAALRHDALPIFSMVMIGFVGPLTVLTLVIVSFRAIRGGNRSASR